LAPNGEIVARSAGHEGLFAQTDTMAGVEVSPETVRSALRGVIDPELGDNIVDLGMVRDIQIAGGLVSVEIALTIAGCPLRAQLRSDVERHTLSLPGITDVKVKIGSMEAEERSALMSRARWKARENSGPNQVSANTRVIAIASGKGGVGKSSVTANLATALAVRGFTVGVLDADIAGFSIPRLLGVEERLVAERSQIIPATLPVGNGALKVVSMGLIQGSGEEEAVMLRGLMLNRALQHFLEDVQWGDLDYLLIDLPPGTSDVQMGLARMLPQSNTLIITTPALAAQQVAARAVDMAHRSHLRVAGIVENMSAYTDENGVTTALFSTGGGERLAESTGTPLLASLPFHPDVSATGDAGTPIVTALPSNPTAVAYSQLAELIATDVIPPVEMSGCSTRLLDAAAAALDALPKK
jgi:ATP-binding protein involved in chromosome partitioning